TSEPRFVAPTRRDRIGRIWAPVLIDGKGPYRLVLDTGANRSAITTRTALSLGEYPPADGAHTLVTGFTGAAMVPTVHVDKVEVGALLMGATDLPVLQDVSAAPRACSASRASPTSASTPTSPTTSWSSRSRTASGRGWASRWCRCARCTAACWSPTCASATCAPRR